MNAKTIVKLNRRISSLMTAVLALACLAITTHSAQAAKVISLSGNLSFGNVQVGSSNQATLTISNAGNATLNVTGITLPPGYSTTFTGGTVHSGGSITALITFAPTTVGSYNGFAVVNSDATSGTSTLPVSGNGLGQAISLLGDLNFGPVPVNTSAQQTLTISNPGTTNLTVTGITYPNGFSGPFFGVLAPGTATNVTVTFSPIAVANYGGTVTVNSDALSGTNTIAASGSGAGGVIALGGNLSFGNVPANTSVQQTLVISNAGSLTLNVSGITYPAGFSGAFSGAIAPGVATNVTVTFSPTALTNYSGTVTVTSDAFSGVNTIGASGTGTGGVIALSGNLSFGNVTINTSAQQTLVISNSGNVNLNVSGITYPAGFSGAFSGSVAPGSAINVFVTFSPTALTNYGGTVTVASDAFAGANTIAASGTGSGGAITVSGNLSFGNVTVNTSAQQLLTISNDGNVTLNVSSITYPAGFSGSFSGAIAAGVQTNVAVTFSPTSPTNYSGTVTVNSDAIGGVNTIAASGTGVAGAIALSGDLNFGNVFLGSSAQLTLTITNIGSDTLNVSSISYPAGFSGAFSGAIAAGASTNVTVTFSPSNAIPYSGVVTVNSDAFSGVNTLNASGTGVAETSIIWLSGDLNFSNIYVGNSSSLELTISNMGNSDLTFTNIELPPGFTVDITNGVLASDTATNVTVTFSPTNAAAYGGPLIVDSDATGGTNTVNVTGIGTLVPTRIIALSGDLAFGPVTEDTSAQLLLTITNIGNANLTFTNIETPAGFSVDITNGVLAPGSTTNVTVTFSPTDTSNYRGTLTVDSDATSGTNTVNVSGTGTASIVPSRVIVLIGSLAFGDVAVGSSPQLTLTISNAGNSDLTISNLILPNGFSGNFSGVIASGATQNVTVTFSPTVNQPYGGTAIVFSDATFGTNTIAVSGDAYKYVAAKMRMNGLFYVSNDVEFASSGYFSGHSTTKSVFSARYRVAGKQYAVSGKLSQTGSYSGNIKRKGLSNLSVTLQAGFDHGTVWKGAISDGSFVAMLHADLAAYQSKTNPAPQAGIYDITIAGSTNASVAPATNGTGTVTVMTSGAARIAVKLGDGTRMTQVTTVATDSTLPFFGSLYGNKGSILGWLTFGNTPGDELNGAVDWFRPANIGHSYPDGFVFDTALTGAKQ